MNEKDCSPRGDPQRVSYQQNSPSARRGRESGSRGRSCPDTRGVRCWDAVDALRGTSPNTCSSFSTYKSVEYPAKRLQGDYPYLHDLEKIALRRGFDIQTPFQGKRIGAFTVLAPSPARYLQLVIQSEKTPKKAPALCSFVKSLSDRRRRAQSGEDGGGLWAIARNPEPEARRSSSLYPIFLGISFPDSAASKNVNCFFGAVPLPPLAAAFFAERNRAKIFAWLSPGYAARNFCRALQVSELGLCFFIAAP